MTRTDALRRGLAGAGEIPTLDADAGIDAAPKFAMTYGEFSGNLPKPTARQYLSICLADPARLLPTDREEIFGPRRLRRQWEGLSCAAFQWVVDDRRRAF